MIAAEVCLQNDLIKRESLSLPGCNKLPFALSKCIKIEIYFKRANAEGILVLVFSQAAGSQAAVAAQKERKRFLRADGWHHTLGALCQLAHNPQDTAKSQMMSEQIRRQHASSGRSGLWAVHDQRRGGGGKKEGEEAEKEEEEGAAVLPWSWRDIGKFFGGLCQIDAGNTAAWHFHWSGIKTPSLGHRKFGEHLFGLTLWHY